MTTEFGAGIKRMTPVFHLKKKEVINKKQYNHRSPVKAGWGIINKL